MDRKIGKKNLLYKQIIKTANLPRPFQPGNSLRLNLCAWRSLNGGKPGKRIEIKELTKTFYYK